MSATRLRMIPKSVLTLILPLWLVLVPMVAVTPSLCGQDAIQGIQGKLASQPVLIAYARNISPGRAVQYIGQLSEKLAIGREMQKEMEQARQTQLEKIQPKVEQPLYGMATYMVSGLIPSFESVSFQQVVDEEDARRLVNGQKEQWGANGFLEDLGNGNFRVEYRSSYFYPLPEGAKESDYVRDYNYSRGNRMHRTVVEKDGKKMVEQQQTLTQFLRYHDQVLYQADFPELVDMELPSQEAISSAVDGATDLGFNAYLDRIPAGMRQLGFTMLSSAAGSQLQQQDEESETQYQMRRSAGEFGLSMVQSVLFDIDNSGGWAKFANADDGSLRGEMRIRARNNSQLTQRLLDAAGVSRFAPVLSDNAAASLHLCVRLPEEASTSLQATAAWMTEEFGKEFSGNPALGSAAGSLTGIVSAVAEHRNIEFLLKLGWSEASDGVIYGGLQVGEIPDLLQSLHTIVSAAAEGGPEVLLEERNGLKVIVVSLDESDIEETRSVIGTNISHIYFAYENSCVWFAAGTSNAVEMIRQSVARCSDNSVAVRTPLVSGKIDMQRWLSYPQNDPARIAQMPYWLDENAWWFPPNPVSVAFAGTSEGRPQPIMQKVFDLGGSQQAGFTLEADDSGILLRGDLGEALANHMVARMIDSQETMQRQMRENAEKEARKAEELQKKQQEESGKASGDNVN